MKGIDIKAFRKANNLTQEMLGDYLGCTKAFISAVEKGLRPLPNEMFSKMLDNLLDWDLSMLIKSEVSTEEKPISNDALVVELRAQIERLEAKVDNLNQELGEKNALIKMMSQGGNNSVRVVGGSLSADVG